MTKQQTLMIGIGIGIGIGGVLALTAPGLLLRPAAGAPAATATVAPATATATVAPATATAAVAPGTAGLAGLVGTQTATGPASSRVIRWGQTPEKFPWGEKRRAFVGESHGTRNLFVSTFVLQPGTTVHPPHRHGQEEFMTIESGAGVWHLDGQDIPARQGDVIYTAPWSLHGLANTGTQPLVYFVVQFDGRGVDRPADPTAVSRSK